MWIRRRRGYRDPVARDLQVEEDLTFQRRLWTAQRIGWVAFAVVLLLALLGLFGDGPLADRVLRSPDGRLTVSLHRFERHRSPSAIVVRVRPEQGEESVEVWVSRDFAEDQRFETVHPEPDAVTVGADRFVYEFRVGADEREVEISFDTQPDGIGRANGRIGVLDGPSVAFGQFVFP